MKISSQLCYAHKIEYVKFFLKILNLEGHQNCIIGSKVREILMNWWIMHIGGVALGRVFTYSLRSRLVCDSDRACDSLAQIFPNIVPVYHHRQGQPAEFLTDNVFL